jgi:hypothetical protein
MTRIQTDIAAKFESSLLRLKRFRDHPLLPTEVSHVCKRSLAALIRTEGRKEKTLRYWSAMTRYYPDGPPLDQIRLASAMRQQRHSQSGVEERLSRQEI